MFPLIVEIITVIVLLIFLPPSQENTNWILPVGVSVWIPHSDVNYGLSLTFL